jgi:hypothetical protein
MTAAELQAARELCEANETEWDDNDPVCPNCNKMVGLESPEYEPRGLCGSCLELLISHVPQLFDEVERLRGLAADTRRMRATEDLKTY